MGSLVIGLLRPIHVSIHLKLSRPYTRKIAIIALHFSCEDLMCSSVKCGHGHNIIALLR